jgi:hypothetical protein
MARTSKGHIQCLPSGSFRVEVYAGTDPVTGKERLLRETCPDEVTATAALARLLKEAQGHQAPHRTPRPHALGNSARAYELISLVGKRYAWYHFAA